MDVMNYFKNFDYKDLKSYRQIAFVLLVIGGLNWGFVGLFGMNFVGSIFGGFLSRLVFIIVGVAAGYECYMFYMDNFAKKASSGAKRSK